MVTGKQISDMVTWEKSSGIVIGQAVTRVTGQAVTWLPVKWRHVHHGVKQGHGYRSSSELVTGQAVTWLPVKQ